MAPNFQRYWKQFSWLSNDITIFLLHLALCDLLYCTGGLPVFVSIFIHGYFK